MSRSVTKNILSALGKTIISCFLISLLIVVVMRFLPFAVTPLMGIRYVGNALHNKPNPTFHKQWLTLKEVNPLFIKAIIAAEDQLFFQHDGFDIAAIKKALKTNQQKRTIKGGSTISQQTAKNAFLWPSRSWIRKGFEAYFTVLIECIWSKQRILEVYVNVIEMGNGIYGIQAASQYYFHKNANQLTAHEAASLAAILPSPLRWNPVKPSPYVRQRIYWIEKQMRQIGNINLQQ